jgi:hypothetical protein
MIFQFTNMAVNQKARLKEDVENNLGAASIEN